MRELLCAENVTENALTQLRLVIEHDVCGTCTEHQLDWIAGMVNDGNP